MQHKLEQAKQLFISKGYRCRNFKDFGFIAKGYKETWRVWINYDGDIVWYSDSLNRLEIVSKLWGIIYETELG